MHYFAKDCSFYHTQTPTAAARNESNAGLITSIEEEDGCRDPHTTLGVTQTPYDDNAEIDEAAREEIVDGEKDAVVVADKEDENADNNNLDDESE